jgi:hypothetical protein
MSRGHQEGHLYLSRHFACVCKGICSQQVIVFLTVQHIAWRAPDYFFAAGPSCCGGSAIIRFVRYVSCSLRAAVLIRHRNRVP